MLDILESLFSDFFKDAFPLADIMFSKLIDIVFRVENHISDGSIFSNTLVDATKSELFFDKIFDVTTSFGVAFLIFKFLKKIFDNYIICSDGDPTNTIENTIIGFCKALIIIFSFNTIYQYFVDISIEFIDDILLAVGIVSKPSLITILEKYFLQAGFFPYVGLLIFFICYLMLVFQLIKRGLEMLILRLGVPIASVGLIDSDNGVFAPYVKMFIQNSITVIIQLAMLKLAFGIVANGNIFFGIAAMGMGLKTPQFLQQFMISVGNGNLGGNINTISQTVSLVRSIRRFS